MKLILALYITVFFIAFPNGRFYDFSDIVIQRIKDNGTAVFKSKKNKRKHK